MSQKNGSLFVPASLIVSLLAIGSLCWIWLGPNASGQSSDKDSLKTVSESDSARRQDSIRVRHRIEPRPAEYVSVTINGVEYIEGIIFLSAEDDTTILKEYGLRIRSARKFGSDRVLCKALWPKEFALESLPEQVLQVRYAAVPKKEKPQRRIEPPPADFPFTTINGIDYADGHVLLESDKDTTLLKDFGFRFLWLEGIDSMGAQYMARWPRELPWDSLPPQLKGVLYDETYKYLKPQLNVSAAAIVADSASPVAPKKEKPQRCIEPPPKDYPVETINGIDYVTGNLLLESEKDTALLRSFGFRDLWLANKDSTGVGYMARWPKELPWDSLPPQLKGVVYDEVFPEEELNVSAVAILADSAAQGKMNPRRRIDPPPWNFPFMQINGRDYASGGVLLESERDTTLLKEFGFWIFRLAKKDSAGAHYRAWWPKDLPWDSLPPQLKGVVYDEVFPEEQLNVSAVAVVADSASPVAPKKEEPRRRIEPPPKDYPIETIDGIDYVTGNLLLESEKDTALLRSLGFRDLWLANKDSTGVAYMARWPKELPWDSLPPQLKGVVYPFPKGTLQPE